jgi:ATP-dependent RNA helicase RhlE
MTSRSFAALGLAAPLVRAVQERGYADPTPIQQQAIPHLLQGRDLLGVAQTGTGKTAAFALPTLQYLDEEQLRAHARMPLALILTPTRELASQVADSFKFYGKHLHLRTAVIFGGVGQGPQVQAMRRGIEILVATPGRLLDLMQQGHVDLRDVEVFVLDEADRMLDMGFIRDVRRIVDELPQERQSLLFSATMPADIVQLANRLLHEPVRVEVTPPATTVEQVEQRLLLSEKASKRDLLVHVLKDPAIERALVFTRTKHGANKVVDHLRRHHLHADAIHGNKSQGARERALEDFRKGRVRVLVATDIAARGIDVPGITHVINFDLPNVPESYVHRIGRTARAGKRGVAISFCDREEREYLHDIEKLIRLELQLVEEHPFRSPLPFRRGVPPTRSKQPAPRPKHPARPKHGAHRHKHVASKPKARHPFRGHRSRSGHGAARR